MREAFTRATPDWRRPSRGQRALVIALTLLAELAFLTILLGLSPDVAPKPERGAAPVTIDLTPDTPAKRTVARPRPAAARARAAPVVPRPPAAPVRIPLAKSPLVTMSNADLASADISKLGSAAGSAQASADSGAASGLGEGPGGARLYKAEWVVEPSHAQLAGYLPDGAPEGSWALIACQTVEHYHVENCEQIGEGPRGSGLARAMRLAAWQFLVRPPRIDGKAMVGAWVKIRIDFNERGRD